MTDQIIEITTHNADDTLVGRGSPKRYLQIIKKRLVMGLFTHATEDVKTGCRAT